MGKLLNCPFCGGEAELHSVDIGSTTDYFISCKECGCKQSGSISRQAVINAWNERKPMANIVEKLEEKHMDISGNTSLHYLYSEGYIDALDYVSDIVKQGINNGLE